MSTYLVESEDITSVANAIRSKSGGNGQLVFPSGFVSEIGNISQDVNNLITGTLNGNLVFTATSVGRAFANTTGSFTLSLPNATTFRPNYTFEGSTLESISAPLITTLPAYCFYTCKKLMMVDLPNVTNVSNNAFINCSGLVTVNLHKATIMDNAFSGCSNLLIAVIGTTHTYYRQFVNCTKLQTLDICEAGRLHQLINNTTGNTLNTLILRSETALTTLYDTNAFNGTAFKSDGAGGTIYIPEVLYDHLGDGSSLDYKSQTNWATYDGYGTITWAKIEGSQYETHYADGTLINSGSN